MFKHSTPLIGFSLAALLAGPALAQNTPSLEGYDGGHVQAETVFQTVDSLGGGATFSAGRLAANPGLEGYSGGGSPSGTPQFATVSTPRPQFANNPAGIRNDAARGALAQGDDDFARIEEKVRTYGR